MDTNKNTSGITLYLTDCGLFPDMDKTLTKIVIEPKTPREVKQIIKNFARGESDMWHVIQRTEGATRLAEELGFRELRDNYVRLSELCVVLFIKRADSVIMNLEAIDSMLENFSFAMAFCA